MENAIVNQILPGTLRALVGAEVEEYDVFSGFPGGQVHVQTNGGDRLEAYGFADLLVPVGHTKTVLRYDGRYYTGKPAATANSFGSGVCYYLGTVLDRLGLQAFLPPLLKDAGIAISEALPEGVEVSKRTDGEKLYRFYLNHSDKPQAVTAIGAGKELLSQRAVDTRQMVELEPFGVAVIREERN